MKKIISLFRLLRLTQKVKNKKEVKISEMLEQLVEAYGENAPRITISFNQHISEGKQGEPSFFYHIGSGQENCFIEKSFARALIKTREISEKQKSYSTNIIEDVIVEQPL